MSPTPTGRLFGHDLVLIRTFRAPIDDVWDALRDFGADARFGFAGAALLPLVPGVLHASSAVTNE